MRRMVVVLLAIYVLMPSPATAQKNFGFDNRKPSGQPYLDAKETVARMKVHPDYEVTVFAAEPQVINPIAFTIDERGRFWVVENFEYPKRTPKGQKPRDRIKILEDTDGDGKCDKVTVWAEGKTLPTGWDLASGIEVGNGGVYLGAPPYLFFLQDKAGKGVCDSQEILLKGFGSHDTHEMLNTFQWGPDGKLYGLHGVFTHSEIDGVKMNAALWRYDTAAKKFEVFAEGTSNPWGLDYDARGQFHLACCVIPHLFHMVPGGTYKRQAGSSFNPYAYGLLNESCDHTHHKDSGWAHAGLVVLEGDHIPRDLQGSVIMGSIHGCSIKRNVLRRAGSTYRAGPAPDFLVSGDKNVRPINMRWGPDGALYLIDWHDQNPCHQAPPDSWDQTRGRIYRIARKAYRPPPTRDLAKATTLELISLLANDNPWWYRTALRMLGERRALDAREILTKAAPTASSERLALRAMWGAYAIGAFDEALAEKCLQQKNPWIRYWAVRFLGEDGKLSPKMLARLTELAKTDSSPEVRLQLASTAQRLKDVDTLPLLHNLLSHKEDAKDAFLPLMVWLAYEPRVTSKRNPALDWLKDNAPGNALVTDEIVPRTLRRLVATGKADDLEACLAFVGQAADGKVRKAALDGLLAGLQKRQVAPPSNWRTVYPKLRDDASPEVRALAGKLAISFQDREAVQRALQIAYDNKHKPEARVDALRDLALAHPPEAIVLLQQLLGVEKNADILMEACRTLAAYDDANIPRHVLLHWSKYPPSVRGEAVQLLAGRKAWATALLQALQAKTVAHQDLSNNTILRIRAFKDQELNNLIETAWGKYRETPADLSALIDKMRGKLFEGGASFARGKKVFENNCAKCHKFQGMGQEVGPALDGAARDIETLLINILDPNRIIGQPYFQRIVELKNGRIESGLLHAEDDKSITLKVENNVLKLIQRSEIEGKIQIQPKSMMPEGLDKSMTEQDLRDLLRYAMAHPFLIDVQLGTLPHSPIMDPLPTLDLTQPLNTKGLQWTRPNVGVAGRIPLPSSKEMTRVYTTATIHSAEAFKTKLLLGAGQPIRVWINGKAIYAGRPAAGAAQPDQASADVALVKGANVVLIEVVYQGEQEAIYARLLDPERVLDQAADGAK